MQRKPNLVAFIATVALVLLLVGISVPFSAPQNLILAQGDSFAGKVIYFTEANGEPTRFDRSGRGISRYGAVLRQLGATVDTLAWKSGIPADTDLLVIVGPVSDLTPDQVARLWLYVNNGGRVLIAAEAVAFQGTTVSGANSALPAARGLFELLFPDFGLQAYDGVLTTERAFAAPTVNAEGTEVPVASVVGAPPYILNGLSASIADSHPVTDGIEDAIFFNGARGIELDVNTPDVTLTPLVFTEESFYSELDIALYLRDRVYEYNIGRDGNRGEQAIVASMENESTGARIVLFGDADILTNGGGFQSWPTYSSNFVYPQNIQLALNATTWLLDVEATELNLGAAAPAATPTVIPSPTPIPPTATPAS